LERKDSGGRRGGGQKSLASVLDGTRIGVAPVLTGKPRMRGGKAEQQRGVRRRVKVKGGERKEKEKEDIAREKGGGTEKSGKGRGD